MSLERVRLPEPAVAAAASNVGRVLLGLASRAVLAAMLCTFGAATGSVAAPGEAAVAQLGDPGQAGPSYGYQPYDDHNPTGFYHPGGMGFGHYYLTQKYHAHRFRTFGYRKFRGT